MIPLKNLAQAMMDWVVLGLLLGVAVAVLVAIIVLRSRSDAPVSAADGPQEAYSDPGVEYEWTVGASQMGRAVLVLLLLGGVAGAIWFLSQEGLGFPGFMQALVTGLGILFAFLSGLLRKKTYQITSDGLYVSSRGKDRLRILAWEHLLWFRPNDNGFKYYLRDNIGRDLPSDKTGFIAGNSIYCGRQATLVNSIILARGVPTSPPQG